MNTVKRLITTKLLVLTIAGFSLAAFGQQTTTWIGTAGDNEWTNGLNWDDGNPPDNASGTNNAVLPSGFPVINYDQPMVAAAFGNLTNNGATLNITTNGFNCSNIVMTMPGTAKIIYMTNSGAVVNVSGNLTMASNSVATLDAGASLTIGGALVISANESSKASGLSAVTNLAGTLIAASTTINNNGGTGTGLLAIKGGTNNLGTTAVGRYNGSSVSTPGTEGLSISGGLVTMTNLNLGNNNVAASFLTAFIKGGTVTNYGSVFINNVTAGRYSRLLQTGGLFVVPDPGVVNPNSTTAGSVTSIYSVTGGTNFVGGFFFGNSNTLVAATAFFTNSATIYVGSQGILSNGASANTIALNNGGIFGATADWTGSANMTLGSGVFTFQAADENGNPFNIALNNPLGGSGTLNKTGNGTLTLNATNTYSGDTLINIGTLAFGPTGLLENSPTMVVASGATLDVSANPTGYPLNDSRTLQGFGTVLGAVNVASGGIINPGSNDVTGTLTVGGLVENGGAINNFFLASSPGPNNDFLIITGDLDVTNVNSVMINGSVPADTVYPLIQYGGNFNGGLSNFSIIGATGSLSNDAVGKTIYLVTASALRSPTNIVWLGNPTNNVWDTTTSSNWSNNGHPDFFVPGDMVLFDNTGAVNPLVNIPGSVTPGSVTVDTTSNYTFLGVGSIGGPAGLTMTNSGTLTILTTNVYTGPTLLNGGVLQVNNLGLSGSPSSIGAATSDPSNLVMNAGILQYTGPTTSTDHGITLTNSGGTLDVVGGTALTLNGNLVGNGSLTVTDAGKVILTGSGNTYTNGTTIAGSTLQINNANAAGTGTITFSNGTLVYFPSGGIMVPNAFNFADGTTNLLVVTSGSSANPTDDGDWSGNGDLLVSNTFNPYTVNGNLDGVTGTISLITPNTFRFNSGGGNSCFGSTNATFDLGAGGVLINRNGGTMNLGALEGGSGSSLQGQDADAGTTIYSIGNNNLSTVFAGSIEDGTSGRFTAITKVGTGTLTLQGSSTYTGATTVSGGTLQVDGQITASAITVPGGVLAGVGTFSGSVDVQAGGTLIPGDGLGQMTIDNTLTLESGSSNIFELNADLGTSATIVGLTSVTYGGNLIVTNVSGTLTAGQSFTLFTAGSYVTSFFDTITLPPLGAGLGWNTNNLYVNGTISVVSTVPPTLQANFSTLSSGSITFSVTNGVPFAPVSVLSSTNVALPLSQWTTVTSGSFDNTGSFNSTVSVDPTVPNQFFILSVQ